MSATDDDPRLTDQALRKGEQEIRKLAVETRTAEIDALTPGLPATLPTGTVDPGSGPSPIGVLGIYLSLDSIATEIVEQVPAGATKVWISTGEQNGGLRALHGTVTSSLERIGRELDTAAKVLEPPKGLLPLAPMAAMTFAASAIPMVAALMRRNTSVRSDSMTLEFPAVAAAVADKLLETGKIDVVIDGKVAPAGDTFRERIADLEKRRDELADGLYTFKLEHVEAQPVEVAASTERLAVLKLAIAEQVKTKPAAELEKEIQEIEAAATLAAEAKTRQAEAVARATRVTAILDDVTALLTALRTADGTGVTPVDRADLYEAVKDAHHLILDPSFAGAESVYEEVPARKDRGLHMGSAVVSYLLIDPARRLVAAGTAAAQAAATTTMGNPTIIWGGRGA